MGSTLVFQFLYINVSNYRYFHTDCSMFLQEIFYIVTNLITPRALFSPTKYLLHSGQTGISAIRSADPENPILEPNTEKSDDPPRRYCHLNFRRWRPSRHFGFGETGNSAIRSADLENPTVEPNMKWIGQPLTNIWPFEIFPNVRSLVGRRSLVGPQYILLLTLFSYTPLRYVRNVAHEEQKIKDGKIKKTLKCVFIEKF